MLAAELLEASESFVEDVQRRAVAEADAFIVAEGDARNRRHLVAGQQLVAEVHRLQTGVTRVNEEVKCAFRLHHADVVDRLEAGKHELALHIVLSTEVFDERLIPLQRCECTVL